MINPGVIELASLQNMEFVNTTIQFRVEDNIGEAIHIHYNDIRIDLSVKEFEQLASKITTIINEVVNVDGFDSKDYDPLFLVGISDKLCHLNKVLVEERDIEDIKVDCFDEKGDIVYKTIENSRVYLALNGIERKNDNHTIQLNRFSNDGCERVSNSERVYGNLDIIQKEGYPGNRNLIVLDNNDRIIDGQHRAASLYYIYGNIRIPVRKLLFNNDVIVSFNKENIDRNNDAVETKKRNRLVEKIISIRKRFLWTSNKYDSAYRDEVNNKLNYICNKMQDIENEISKIKSNFGR